MRARSRSKEKALEEPDPSKEELITSLLKLQAFYNKVPSISQLFNPVEAYLGPPPVEITTSFHITASQASRQIRSMNQLSSFNDFQDKINLLESEDKDLFKPADEFKYEMNPYNRELLDHKKM